MAQKIYVGNLNYNTTEESLREGFSGFGQVESVVIIKDKFNGRSRGYGFVEFSTEEEALKAIEKMNGVEFEGRKLRVNTTQEKRRDQTMPV